MRRLRDAVMADAISVITWLHDPRDCRWATGQEAIDLDTFSRWMLADDQVGYLLEEDGTPLGYGEIWIDDEVRDCELAHLVVDPTRRRQGIGRQLTEALYQVAQRRAPGWPVFMRVSPDNTGASACYQNVGFRPVTVLTPDMEAGWVWMSREV